MGDLDEQALELLRESDELIGVLIIGVRLQGNNVVRTSRGEAMSKDAEERAKAIPSLIVALGMALEDASAELTKQRTQKALAELVSETPADTVGKHPVQKLMEHAGYEPRKYSGRGMHGRQCLAADVNTPNEFYARMTVNLSRLESDERVIVAEAMERMCTDNLGKRFVMYFPKIAPPER